MKKKILLIILTVVLLQASYHTLAQSDACTPEYIGEGNHVLPVSNQYLYWYAFEMPAGADQKLQVSLTAGYYYQIYRGSCDQLYYSGSGYNTGQFASIPAGELVHIVFYVSPSSTFSWSLSVIPIEAGDNCAQPAIANEGLNNVPAGSTTEYWLTFQMPDATKKLTLSTGYGVYVSIRSGDCPNPYYLAAGYNNAVANEIVPGTQVYVYLQFYGAREAFTFNLELSDLGQGETCASATAVTANPSILFPGGNSQYYWYKFTPEPSKKVVINTNGSFEYVTAYSGTCSQLQYQGSGYGLQLTDLPAGEQILLRFSNQEQTQFDWSLTFADVDMGDNCGNAIQIDPGYYEWQNAVSSRRWYSIRVPGENQRLVFSSGNMYATLYRGDCINGLQYLESGNEFTVGELVDAEVIYVAVEASFPDIHDFTIGFEDDLSNTCQSAEVAASGLNEVQTVPYWFTYTVDTPGDITISTLGTASSDTYVQIWNDCNGNLIAESDDYYFNNTYVAQSQVTLSGLAAGTVLKIRWLDTFSSEPFEFRVGKSQSITFASLADVSYGTAPIQLNASATSGLPVQYSVIQGPAEISGNVLTITGSGQVSIRAAQPGNNEFAPAGFVQRTFTVNKAQLTIAADNKTKTYAAALPTLTRSFTGFVNGDDPNDLDVLPNISTIANQFSNVGTYEITLSGGYDNAYEYVLQNGTIAIEKAAQQINSSPIGAQTIGGGNINIQANATSNLPLEYSIIEGPAQWNGSSIVLGNTSGLVRILLQQSGNQNYNAASPVELSFVLNDPNKLAQAITFAPAQLEFSYGQSTSLTASASSGLGVTYHILSGSAGINGNSIQFTGASPVTIEARQNGNASYNPASPVQAVFNIGKATLAITAESKQRMFGTANPAFTATYSGFVNNDDVSSLDVQPSFSTTATTESNVGNYPITISGGSDDHYTFNFSPGVLTILRASQQIEFAAIPSKSPTDAPFTLSATATSGLTVNYQSSVPEVATVSGNTVTIHGPGTTIITASQSGNLNYLAAPEVQQSLSIKFAQSITFNELPLKHFGDPNFSLNGTSNANLPVAYVSSNSQIASVEGSIVTIHKVGTVKITASQNGNSQYLPATPVERSLVIEKGTQTIDFTAPIALVVGQDPVTLSATASSGLPVSFSENSDRVSIVGNVLTLTGEGNAVITASQSGNENYSAATPVDVTICVNPPKPQITIGGLGTEGPVLTSSATSGNQWHKDGQPIAGATDQNYTITSAGAYTVRVTKDGCTSQASDEELIVITDVEAGKDVLQIFPNPFTNELLINTAYFKDARLTIDLVDSSGKIVKTEVGSGFVRMPTKDLTAGNYVIILRHGSTSITRKVVKR